ncbi:MAG: hypothetical protein FD135_1089 [Comamonadaceae bacterium]|nr:MAG: hypothetical protein FD135_1089 [Comamonadaceae bacterium]
MPASQALADIDWTAPWLSPWRRCGEPIAQRVLSTGLQPAALNAAVQNRWPDTRQAPVRFVPQADLPAGQAYEQYIFDSAQCPTREGLHDFFNGLAWLHFPQIKQRLNHLHVAQIAQTGIAPVRGPARDGLTLFDENAALIRAPDELWQDLLAKNWRRVFVDLRPLWAETTLVLFGHALLEKLVYPRKPITAHVYRAHPATDCIADMDAWVAASLSAEQLASKPFAHLPVLGVPGWWPANETPGFYDDASVFRPARTQEVIAG